MKVREVMNRRILKVGPETPLHRILQLLLRAQLNDLVVVDDKDKLLGIVTYGDLSRKLLPNEQELMEHPEYLTDPELMEDRIQDIVNVSVDEIMTKRIITISPESSALKAGAIMHAHRVKQLPVVENQKVVGIISHSDIGWGLMMKYSDGMKG